jgi:F-type H+-transporting ATPase subunit epsilon
LAESGLPRKLQLEIVSPSGLLLDEAVDSVQVPGEFGSFGVLPGHTPFLATLGEGEISFQAGSHRESMTCFWGFCEVLPDRVSILAEFGERAEDIDLERAERAAERAAARLAKTASEEGYGEAVESYKRALTRLTVAKKHKS